MEYILIIFMSYYGKYPMVQHIEFKDESSCKSAKIELSRLDKYKQRGNALFIECVKK